MQLIKILSAAVLISCAGVDQTSSIEQIDPEPESLEADAPCEVEVLASDTSSLVDVQYTLSCPVGQFSASIVEVTSNKGNWGDVTRWVLCGHTYTEEFTHPKFAVSMAPWAILSVYDGNGGPISSCQTPNTPIFAKASTEALTKLAFMINPSK